MIIYIKNILASTIDLRPIEYPELDDPLNNHQLAFKHYIKGESF